jgi:hypothetical protein
VAFVVVGEPTTVADPGQSTLHDPAVWQHDEPVAVTIGRASPHSAVKLLNGPMGESPRWS